MHPKFDPRQMVHVFVDARDTGKKYPRTIVVSYTYRLSKQNGDRDAYQVYDGQNHAGYAFTLTLDAAIKLAKELAHWPLPATT